MKKPISNIIIPIITLSCFGMISSQFSKSTVLPTTMASSIVPIPIFSLKSKSIAIMVKEIMMLDVPYKMPSFSDKPIQNVSQGFTPKLACIIKYVPTAKNISPAVASSEFLKISNLF